MLQKKRMVGFLLVLCLLAAIFAGCSDGKDPQSTSNSTPDASGTGSAPADSTPAETTPAPETTELNFNGYEFTMGASAEWVEKWMPAAGVNTLDDELLDEYAALEEQYGFTINVVQADNLIENVMPVVMGGDVPWDVFEMKTAQFFPLAVQNYLVNYDSEEMKAAGLDVDDPALVNIPLSRLSVIAGKQWGIRCCSKYDLPEFGYGILFNKDMVANAGYPAETLYQMVRDGEWNFTAYKDLADKIAKDNDGDGQWDVYSAGGGKNPYGSEVLLAGGSAIEERDGKWVYTLNEANSIQGLQFMYDVFNSGHRLIGGAGDSRTAFAQEQVGMLWAAGFYLQNDTIKGCEFEYGLIPMPKGDDVEGYVDAISSPSEMIIFAGKADYDVNIPILSLWCAVMNSEDNWVEPVKEDFFRGSDEDMEMLTEYILPNLRLATYKLSAEMETLIENEVYWKVQAGELTPAQAAEAVSTQVQSILDGTFNK